ncbi:hypothetical protein [Streptomyces sp. CoH17]|uniref:hypothetical protein n=1 Tax=Streptomyces sp. CoH17 TaxID=2992806 RepID=UPI0022721E67|nr:hypothetical protein [Streptomyces sp. CoH17]
MVNNLRWAELLPSVATDLSPFVKSLGKFQDNLGLYGIGTGIAGLEGVNQIIKETRAAYGIWMRPDQEHIKPSLTRFAFGAVNVAGYGLYGAGAAGFLGRYSTGGGLLLVTASNVLKQHFLPAEQTYRPDDPVLPLHRSDTAANVPPAAGRADVPELGNIARYARALLPASSASPDPLVAPLAARDPNDRWLQAGAMETGMVRPVPSRPRSQVHRPLAGIPVTDAAVGGTPDIENPVAATAGASPYRQGWSRSLPDMRTAPPANTDTWRRGTTEYAVASSPSDSARRRTR